MPYTFTRIAAAAFSVFAGLASSGQSALLARVEVLRDEAPEFVTAVVSSPDGLHVYGGDSAASKLTLLSRDAGTGALTPVKAYFNGIDGAWGLQGLNGLALSPDGNHLYTAAYADHGIGIYQRSGSDGALSFVDIVVDGQFGVDGLSLAWAVAISPDGAYVFAAGNGDNAVISFVRSVSDGRLTFVEAEFDGVEGVDGLSAASSVAVSPDGAHVYVTGTADHAVAVFSVDTGTGALTFVEAEFDGVAGVNGLFSASAASVSPDGDYVYVAGAGGTVAVFARNSVDGTLDFVTSYNDDPPATDGLGGARALVFSPDGAQLYVTGEIDGAVVAFARDAGTGELTRIADYIDGQNGLDGLAGAYTPFAAPDGKHVYVAGRSDGAIAVFARDSGDGSLTFVTDAFDGPPGHDGLDGAVSAAVSPDGAQVYVAGYIDNTVTVFERDLAAGTLVPVQFVEDDQNGISGMSGPYAVTVAPDGAHVYVAARFDHAILAFTRNAFDGTLTFAGTVVDGALGVDGIGGVSAITVSPDGAHLYAAGNFDNAVALFARDGSSGLLAFVEAYFDGVNGVDGIGFPIALQVSPDGAHAYVTGGADDAIATFARDPVNGSLSLVQTVVDGVNGVTGIDNAYDLVIAPDGGHVYATGQNPLTVAGFARNAATGELSFIGVQASDALGLAIAPDGRYLVATDFLSGAVKAFRRDAATGALDFASAVTDVDGPVGVVAAPDGGHFYTVSHTSSSVAVFAKGVDATVSGHILDLTLGDAVTCAVVELSNAGGSIVESAVADRNGYYFFTGLPGDVYTARILAPGYGETVSATPIDLTAGGAVTRDFFLAAVDGAGGVQGLVTDASTSQPIVAASVKLIVNGAVFARTYTCASGRFEFAAIPAKGGGGTEADLLFEAENYGVELQTVATVSGETVTANQAMAKSVAGAATLAGIVSADAPPTAVEPLYDADVTIRGPVNTSTRTSNNGTYLFAALNDGTYTVHASADGFGGQTGARTLAGGAVAAVNFTLAPIADPDPAVLVVTPAERSVGSGFASFVIAVSNGGAGTMAWGAAAIEGGDWLDIAPETGAGAGEITVYCPVNNDASPRTGRIRIAASGAETMFQDVVVTQGRRGDINGDGSANAVDIQIAVNAALGLSGGGNADVSGDETVDAIDVQIAINAALGL